MSQYFFANGSEQRGPYSLEEMASLGLRPDTLAWREGMSQWQRVDAIPELVAAMNAARPGAPPVHAPPSYQSAPQPTAQLNYQLNPSVQTDGMAIASLVLGLLSVLTVCIYGLGMVPGILAIVFGFIGRARTRRGESSGAGMALAGLILGFISTGLVMLFIVIVVAVALIGAMK